MNEGANKVSTEKPTSSQTMAHCVQDGFSPATPLEDTLHDARNDVYSVFSNATKTYLPYLLGVVITTSTLTATIYFPLIAMLSTHFHVSVQSINLTITVYAICQALSSMIFATLADSYGRRPVLLLLLNIYAIASLGLAINKNSYSVLIGMRALQSIGGSATPPIAYGIVSDIAVVAERGKMLGPMLSTCNAISAIGPIVGGAVALRTDGYMWVFLSLLVVAVSCVFLVGFTIPETARNVALNGSRHVGGIRGPWASFLGWETKIWSPGTKNSELEGQRKSWNLNSASGALRIILYPDAALVLWMNASAYSIYYIFQVTTPVIFAEVYKYNPLKIGLVLPSLAGMTIGGVVAGKLIDFNYKKELREHGLATLESQMNPLYLGGFSIERARYRGIVPLIAIEAALVIGYGWAVHGRVDPAVPITLQFFICTLATMLSHIASALLVDIFPDTPSTAYASGQTVRCALCAALAASIQPLTKTVGRGWFFTMFALFTGPTCGLCVLGSRLKGMQWRIKRSSTNASETILDSQFRTGKERCSGA